MSISCPWQKRKSSSIPAPCLAIGNLALLTKTIFNTVLFFFFYYALLTLKVGDLQRMQKCIASHWTCCCPPHQVPFTMPINYNHTVLLYTFGGNYVVLFQFWLNYSCCYISNLLGSREHFKYFKEHIFLRFYKHLLVYQPRSFSRDGTDIK